MPILTVAARPYAAIGITIDWTGTVPAPQLTLVTRLVAGVTVNVRGADMASTPGGFGYVQDNEAPLSGVITYRAYGYSDTGALMATSPTTPINLTAPAIPTAWLKGVDNPHLSREVVLADVLDEQWTQQTETFTLVPDSVGVAYPVVWQAPGPSGYEGRLLLRVGSKAEHDALMALVTSGVLLLQSTVEYGHPRDMYLRVPGGKVVKPQIPGWVLRWLDVPFIEVGRPDTADSPVIVPGWTYDIADAAYATYALRDAAFASYNALTKGP